MCDQAGARLLQRYIQWRRLQQLMREISTLSVAKRSSAPVQASAAVDPRQVRLPHQSSWELESLMQSANCRPGSRGCSGPG